MASQFHVRYRYTNKSAGTALPCSGRGDHQITLSDVPKPTELFEIVRNHLVLSMEAQGWTENVVTIIDVVPVE
ncbi:MAG: hypothetical protein IAF58_13755 [Leptolyngbya sp.]|nr:hypothetical protein [Candidatus Melainabacteria bacterium]